MSHSDALKSLIKPMNRTRNTLPPHIRKEAIGALNNTVAELFDLFARIKQAHWNVRGTAFIGLHKLLDEFAGKVMSHIDLAAERATALGGIVEGTLRESVKHSQLKKKEEPSSISGLSDWIHELADVHAAAGERVRMAIKKNDRRRGFRHGGFADGCFAHPGSATLASGSANQPAANLKPNQIMLYTIALILIIAWLLGLVSDYTMGGFIHILLIVAIIMILVRLIQGRRL